MPATARRKAQCDPCFSLSLPQFSYQRNRSTFLSLIPLLQRSDSTTLGFLFHLHGLLSVPPFSSRWHHLHTHSSLFAICFVMVSPVLKDFITVLPVFYKEHVIQSQNELLLLLPYLSLLLVLFRGIKCCCLCSSTQSYRFSITKALYQRM